MDAYLLNVEFDEMLRWAVEKADQRNEVLWIACLVDDRVCLNCLEVGYPTFKAIFLKKDTRHYTNVYICGKCGVVHSPKEGYNSNMKVGLEMVQVDWLQGKKREVISWAKEVMSDPKTVFLDTETTGLNEGEIVSIAIINSAGEVVLHTLVKPQHGIPHKATEIHGITEAMVSEAPTWREVAPLVKLAIEGKRVVIYNAVYDRKMMHKSAEAVGMEKIDWKTIANFECAMEKFAEFYGEFNDYHGSFRWQKLGYAYYHMMRVDEPGAHDALVDTEMVRQVVLAMSETSYGK